jgi:ribosomal protein S4
MKGVAGENLIQLLERRLDNVVYRMGFASDHAEARQLVRHGHFTINGKKVNIPSYLVRPRTTWSLVRESSQKMARINEALAAVDRRGVPQWIELDKDGFRGPSSSCRPARTSRCRFASSSSSSSTRSSGRVSLASAKESGPTAGAVYTRSIEPRWHDRGRREHRESNKE